MCPNCWLARGVGIGLLALVLVVLYLLCLMYYWSWVGGIFTNIFYFDGVILRLLSRVAYISGALGAIIPHQGCQTLP